MSADKKATSRTEISRPPVIAVMGHIDHGKSTLLDYIRKTRIVETEAGGITQHLSAYEVTHKTKDGKEQKITFLDTPGHEAFSEMRSRGAKVADIAILVVSAEDGVKQQTKEALASIKEANIPFIVAINKIDKPEANVERTKQSLAENDIFVEGYGGDIPYVPISAKQGTGVDELMDMVLLVAEMEDLRGDPSKNAEGIVIESHLDPKKGISATLVIKDGTLKQGMYVVAEKSISPVRIFEDFTGKAISSATFSSPVRVTGWDTLPPVGARFTSFTSKKEAEAEAETYTEKAAQALIAKSSPDRTDASDDEEILTLPLIIKTDVAGMIDAIKKEIAKIHHDRVRISIVHAGAGNITEGDIKLAAGNKNALVIGFGVKIDGRARDMAERTGIEIHLFDIIYKLTEWLAEEVQKRAPKTLVDEITGKAKILKTFSKMKNKQVVGGKVLEGEICSGARVKIIRRDNEIGQGEVAGLQRQKVDTKAVSEEDEFGAMIESIVEIAPGDIVEAFVTVER